MIKRYNKFNLQRPDYWSKERRDKANLHWFSCRDAHHMCQKRTVPTRPDCWQLNSSIDFSISGIDYRGIFPECWEDHFFYYSWTKTADKAKLIESDFGITLSDGYWLSSEFECRFFPSKAAQNAATTAVLQTAVFVGPNSSRGFQPFFLESQTSLPPPAACSFCGQIATLISNSPDEEFFCPGRRHSTPYKVNLPFCSMGCWDKHHEKISAERATIRQQKEEEEQWLRKSKELLKRAKELLKPPGERREVRQSPRRESKLPVTSQNSCPL
jgi:hypothetical protein